MEISKNITENEAYLQEQCKACADIHIRPMALGQNPKILCLVVYMETVVSNMMLEESMLGRLINHLWEMPSGQLERFADENALGISDMNLLQTMEEAMAAMLAGNAVLFMDDYSKAIKISGKGYPGRGVGKAENEKVIKGSQEAFTESVKVNTALVRKRIRSTGLKAEELFVGCRSDTVTALLYMEEIAYPEIVEEAKKRLQEYEIDGIFDGGMAEQLEEKHWLSPFPQLETTERPDRAAMELLNGRVLLLCDNSPTGVLFPATLHNFLQSAEDRYNRFEMVSFERILRYLALLASLTISGLYLAVISFHTQILPTNLLLSFAESRKGVPFPSLLEVLLMELAFEMIREAGVRMPGPLSGTIGIVGGLIIGDAAVSANLVSPMAVVVVAFSALSSFAIPKNDFSAAVRLLKYGFILLGGFFGIFGITLGWYLLLGHLSGLTSFRIPYLMPFVSRGLKGWKREYNSIFRAPFRQLKNRPVFARRAQRVRLRKKEGADV